MYKFKVDRPILIIYHGNLHFTCRALPAEGNKDENPGFYTHFHLVGF